MKNLIATNGNTIIQPIEEEEGMAGNIVLPDMEQKKPFKGIILTTSDQYNYHRGEYVPTLFKKGMKILYPSLGGTKINLNNEEYIIIASHDILGIIEE